MKSGDSRGYFGRRLSRLTLLSSCVVGALASTAAAFEPTIGQPASGVLGQLTFDTSGAGSTMSMLNLPHSVAVDPISGSVFVADTNNNRVLRYASSALYTNGAAAASYLGTGATCTQSGLLMPSSVHVDTAGTLWVVDNAGQRVLRYDNAASLPSGANASGVLGQPNFVTCGAGLSVSKLNNPVAVTSDALGNVWIAEITNNRVLRFDAAATLVDGAPASNVLGQTNFASFANGVSAAELHGPTGLAVDADGRLWVADRLNHRVLRFDDAATLPNGAAASAVLGQASFNVADPPNVSQNRLYNPAGVATDAYGNLFVADANNNRVVVFADAGLLPNGSPASSVLGQANFDTATASTTAAKLFMPWGVAVHADTDELLVADSGNNRVLRFTDGDADGDGVSDAQDNCPALANANQANLDGDALGDACDTDDDGDGVADADDNCASVSNPAQADQDGDGLGDVCDGDADGDGVAESDDNCPGTANADQQDLDGDGAGDYCDDDDDGDLIPDGSDNCVAVANALQADLDGDALGDACDDDDDDDTVADDDDNCLMTSNANQANLDGDALGDACDADLDGDGVLNVVDNCSQVSNADQADVDGDGEGDICDADDDDDGDGVFDVFDNCATIANADQADLDGDALGDACDADLDGDGVANATDNCVVLANADQTNTDWDSLGDACDGDDDNDTVLDGDDNCPFDANQNQLDSDQDGIGDACTPDEDGDGVADGADACSGTAAGALVNPSNGCALAQLCPCAGPRGGNAGWRNRGQYQSCVSGAAGSWVTLGLISQAESSAVISAAAQSSCGRR